MIKTISALYTAAMAQAALPRLAVAAAHDEAVLQAVAAAKAQGIVEPILVGNLAQTQTLLQQLGEDAAAYTLLEAAGAADCARQAVALVARGEADFLMKGLLNTSELMRAVLAPEAGLRGAGLISHVMLYETPAYPKLLALTDGGMNPFPDLAKKTAILENAAALLCQLGYQELVAACVCGAEQVDAKIQSTVDAQALAAMHGRWAAYQMRVLGPVGLDLAISEQACRHKGYTEPGGGQADILLVPSYEVGNGIGKTLTYFAAAKSAGIITGARVPIVLVSRADEAETKLASIALGSLLVAK